MLPLERSHPHARDGCIAFETELHKYTVTQPKRFPEKVPVSVTGFAKDYFKQFDGRATVDRYYSRWKNDPQSKYHAMIAAALREGLEDEDAKQRILVHWASTNDRASRDGTAMHAEAELLCNGMQPAVESPEMAMLRRWLAEWEPHMEWEPVRTEWMLWWEDERIAGDVLVAGTLDLLMRSKTADVYALVDFKRTNPKPKFDGGDRSLLGPNVNPKWHPGYAKAPLGDLEDSKWGQYTMQLNILAKMLRERYGIDVKDRMYLLQLHPDLDEPHCAKVDAHSKATDALFAIEVIRRTEARAQPR
tara:strand:+ start:719 stop:1627 length:909 start_codon:yes stop_codon:yes gene_type:complete